MTVLMGDTLVIPSGLYQRLQNGESLETVLKGCRTIILGKMPDPFQLSTQLSMITEPTFSSDLGLRFNPINTTSKIESLAFFSHLITEKPTKSVVEERIDGLRQAIVENPTEYHLRLIFADAIEEAVPQMAGEADLIRNQEWRVSIQYRDSEEIRRNYGRGNLFIEAVWCNLYEWIESGPFLVRNHPIQWVRLTDELLGYGIPDPEYVVVEIPDPANEISFPLFIFERFRSDDTFLGDRFEYRLKSRLATRQRLSHALIEWAKSPNAEKESKAWLEVNPES